MARIRDSPQKCGKIHDRSKPKEAPRPTVHCHAEPYSTLPTPCFSDLGSSLPSTYLHYFFTSVPRATSQWEPPTFCTPSPHSSSSDVSTNASLEWPGAEGGVRLRALHSRPQAPSHSSCPQFLPSRGSRSRGNGSSCWEDETE